MPAPHRRSPPHERRRADPPLARPRGAQSRGRVPRPEKDPRCAGASSSSRIGARRSRVSGGIGLATLPRPRRRRRPRRPSRVVAPAPARTSTAHDRGAAGHPAPTARGPHRLGDPRPSPTSSKARLTGVAVLLREGRARPPTGPSSSSPMTTSRPWPPAQPSPPHDTTSTRPSTWPSRPSPSTRATSAPSPSGSTPSPSSAATTSRWTALRIADRRQPSTAIAARYAYALELRGDLARAAAILKSAAAPSSRAGPLLPADAARRHPATPGPTAAGRHRQLRTARQATPGLPPGPGLHRRGCTSRGATWIVPSRTWQARGGPAAPARVPHRARRALPPSGSRDRGPGASSQSSTPRSPCSSPAGSTPTWRPPLYEADHGSARACPAASARGVGAAPRASMSPTPRPGPCTRRPRRPGPQSGSAGHRAWARPTPGSGSTAGRIEAALGMDRALRIHLRRGLAGDPGLSPWQRDQARSGPAARWRAHDETDRPTHRSPSSAVAGERRR